MSSKAAVKAASSAGQVVSVYKKYTVQSTGIWDWIRRVLSVDPNRSNGIPLNAQYRNPPPGALDPQSYDDPTTIPAADIAENQYFKRDARRNYPRLSVINQADVVALLTVGSKVAPKEAERPLIGEEGAKQLTLVRQEGREKGLAAFFQKDKTTAAGVLGPSGLPPLPSGLSHQRDGSKRYDFSPDEAYPDGYPCRNFS